MPLTVHTLCRCFPRRGASHRDPMQLATGATCMSLSLDSPYLWNAPRLDSALRPPRGWLRGFGRCDAGLGMNNFVLSEDVDGQCMMHQR